MQPSNEQKVKTSRYCPPYAPMVGVLPEGSVGDWRIEHFEMTEDEVKFAQLRDAINFRRGESRDLQAGRYVKLVGPGGTWMSDTPMERRTCYPLVREAHGHVLLAGLGLGMVLVPLLDDAAVESITVLEVERDVIELVLPTMLELQEMAGRDDDFLTIIEADAFTWKPPKGTEYDTIWLDIWRDISEDNYEGMKTLHRRYAHWKNPNGWMRSWRVEDMRM